MCSTLAQAVPEVQPNAPTDYLNREAMTIVVARFIHDAYSARESTSRPMN
jgi:hypothetical protein